MGKTAVKRRRDSTILRILADPNSWGLKGLGKEEKFLVL
jgi:hypothetical protein